MNPVRHPSTQDLSATDAPQDELSSEEQSILLRIAHDSIVSKLQRKEISFQAPTDRLAQSRGVFTSLYVRDQFGSDQLRGCVGYVRPDIPLYRAVAESARAAAFEDSRFSPLGGEELPNLLVELSVLSTLRSISAEEITVGLHGLLISQEGRRGLLLPQVAIEHGWDRTTFLEQTCRKAGLPIHAWKEGASVEAFTAQVFGERTQID